MFYAKAFVKRVPMFAITVLLAACTGVASVKDVINDQPAYLAKNFGLSSISPAIINKLPVDKTAPNATPLSFVTEANSEATDGKKISWKSTITLTDLGHGIFQKTEERSNNDIPYATIYSLNYRGVLDLRWQIVPLHGTMTSWIREVKEIKQFDPLPTTSNGDFTISYSSGNMMQIANYVEGKKICTTSRTLTAAELNPKLLGNGIELECQDFVNDTLAYRSKWIYLKNYGVAVETEQAGSAYKTTIRIIGIGK